MPRFFNTQSDARAAAQLASLVLFAYALYTYYSDPEARFSELGMEMLIQGVSVYSLGENANPHVDALVMLCNVFGSGVAYGAASSGNSSFGLLMNLANIIGFIAVGITSLLTSEHNKPRISPALS